MSTAPTWLSLSAYARTYGVDRKTAAKWLADGLLISFRTQTLIRVQAQPPTKIPDSSQMDVKREHL